MRVSPKGCTRLRDGRARAGKPTKTRATPFELLILAKSRRLRAGGRAHAQRSGRRAAGRQAHNRYQRIIRLGFESVYVDVVREALERVRRRAFWRAGRRPVLSSTLQLSIVPESRYLETYIE